jgi:hypothetical protein
VEARVAPLRRRKARRAVKESTMKSASHGLAYLGIVSLVVTVQACSSSSNSASSPLKVGGVYYNPNAGAGPEYLNILSGGKYRLDMPRVGSNINGTVAISGDKATFTEVAGGDCLGEPGVYTVAATATAVTFKTVQDPCKFRIQDWTSGPWTIQH